MAASLSSLSLSSGLLSLVSRGAVQSKCVSDTRSASLSLKVTASTEEARVPGVHVNRRDALVGLSSVAGLLALEPAFLPSDANAADLNQRIQRGAYLEIVKEKTKGAVNANPALLPDFFRLALNDAATYDKATKTGGPNGSIRFSEELSRPENAGLDKVLSILAEVKEDIEATVRGGGPVSWADLIIIAADEAVRRTFLNYAVEKAGGDETKGLKLYFAIGSAGQWGAFEKQFGRTDAEEADPAGRVPIWSEASTAEIKAKLAGLGLKPRDVVALGLFYGPDLAATEAKLAEDEELRPFVEKFQKSRKTTSQSVYQVDLIAAFGKLAALSGPVNYEAYTYALTRKIKF